VDEKAQGIAYPTPYPLKGGDVKPIDPQPFGGMEEIKYKGNQRPLSGGRGFVALRSMLFTIFAPLMNATIIHIIIK
jgi:hypothetical protein